MMAELNVYGTTKLICAPAGGGTCVPLEGEICAPLEGGESAPAGGGNLRLAGGGLNLHPAGGRICVVIDIAREQMTPFNLS